MSAQSVNLLNMFSFDTIMPKQLIPHYLLEDIELEF